MTIKKINIEEIKINQEILVCKNKEWVKVKVSIIDSRGSGSVSCYEYGNLRFSFSSPQHVRLLNSQQKDEIGFKDVDGNYLKENAIYNCHRFMYYIGAEIDCTCQAKVVYSSRMAAFGLKMIDGNFGHEIEDYENDVIPLCSIEGLHEESFTLFKIRQ